MANQMTVAEIVAAASTLTVEQQHALNKALCSMIKSNRTIKAAVAGAQFSIGQVVKFDAKTRGIKFIKIAKFNRAGTAVVGAECKADGTEIQFAPRWTVGNNICTAV